MSSCANTSDYYNQSRGKQTIYSTITQSKARHHMAKTAPWMIEIQS